MNASPPQVLVCRDAQIASQRVAELIRDSIRANPRIVLGLATGGTPVDTYRELVRMHREEGLDFSQVTSFNLDEYIGLGPEHPQSFRFFMQAQLFDHVNIDPAKTFVPNGLGTDVEAEAAEYERRITSAGGIDLQLLGIGGNGHIAFNEPGSTVDCRTRQIELTDSTINANARFFQSIDQVPRTAVTMGIGTILEAKRIVLLAMGESKSAAIEQAVRGKLDSSNPASLLQTHNDVLFVLDNAAAKGLPSDSATV
ncbi:MAG: glucosamine-6-phosphate deaminase [Rubripirellula sp.]